MSLAASGVITCPSGRQRCPTSSGDRLTTHSGILIMPATIETAKAVVYNRVPSVTADFWLIKLMAVTMGETAADYLNVQMGFGSDGDIADHVWHTSGRIDLAICAEKICSRCLLAFGGADQHRRHVNH